MDVDVEALGKSLGNLLISEGKEFVSDESDEYKAIMFDIGMDLAKLRLEKIRADTPERKAQIDQSIGYVEDGVASRFSESQVELVNRGESMLPKLVGIIGKTLLLAIL